MPLLAELMFPLPSSSSLSFLPSPQVVFPPGSPIPLRRTFSVLPSPPPVPLLQHHRDASASNSSPPPSLPTPSTLGPSAIPRGSPGVQSAGAGPREEDAQGPAPPSTAPHTSRSVGCQTDEDPLFPPMQAGPGPQRESCLCPLCTHAHVHTYTVPRSCLRARLEDPQPDVLAPTPGRQLFWGFLSA